MLTWVGLCTWGKAGGWWGQGEWHALGFRRGGGVSRRGTVHWLPAAKKQKKKLLMALLHDWAFVTAIVLPATSARDTVLWASQLLINHLPRITKEAASSPPGWFFVFLETWPYKVYLGPLWHRKVCYKKKSKGGVFQSHSVQPISKRTQIHTCKGWLLIIGLLLNLGHSINKSTKLSIFRLNTAAGGVEKSHCKMCSKGHITCRLMTFYVELSL